MIKNKKMTKTTEILLGRRTIRKYTSEPVDDKLLNESSRNGMPGFNYREYAGLQYNYYKG